MTDKPFRPRGVNPAVRVEAESERPPVAMSWKKTPWRTKNSSSAGIAAIDLYDRYGNVMRRMKRSSGGRLVSASPRFLMTLLDSPHSSHMT